MMMGACKTLNSVLYSCNSVYKLALDSHGTQFLNIVHSKYFKIHLTGLVIKTIYLNNENNKGLKSTQHQHCQQCWLCKAFHT